MSDTRQEQQAERRRAAAPPTYRRRTVLRAALAATAVGALTGPRQAVRAQGPAAATPTTIDDTHPYLEYSDGWEARPNIGGRYNNTDHQASPAGRTVELVFNGTGITLIGEKSPGRGSADIYIDGVLQQTVSYVAAAQALQQTIYEKTDLPPGVHTFKLVSKGNGWIYVDAFKLVGTPQLPEKIVVKSAGLSDPTGLYVLEGGAPALPAAVVELRNRHSYAVNGTVKWAILARGQRPIAEGTVTFAAASEEAKQLTIPTVALAAADYYVLNTEVLDRDGTVSDRRQRGFGVIHPAAKGLRPRSPFGLGIREESDPVVSKQIGEKIGAKWTRGIKAVDPRIVNPAPGVFWGEADIAKARQEILEWHKHGIVPLGYINYNMPWNVAPGPNGEQLKPHQNRPKDLGAQAEMVYRSIAPLQDLVKEWEVWNEPWVHGWTWKTGDAQDYREMTRLIWNRVKPEFPAVNLIGGGSVAYNRDIVYAKGAPDTGYIDGSASHAYGLPDPAQLAGVKTQRALDTRWSKSGGRAGLWQTELGTADFMFPQLPEAERPYGVARTVAPTYLLHLLGAGDAPIHIFWFALSYDRPYSGGDHNVYDPATRTPKPAVVAFSAMTHFLEDSTLVAGLYPEAKAAWGFVFRRQDGKATAALYLDAGHEGAVTLRRAGGIKVYDYLGGLVADGGKEELTLALKPWETYYLVSERSAEELAALLNDATYTLAKPLSVTPLSFTEPIGKQTRLDVQVENLSPNAVSGKLTLTMPQGWDLAPPFAMLNNLQPGEQRVVTFNTQRTAVSDINRYPVGYTVELHGRGREVVATQTGQQTIQVAYAPRKTIAIDGNLGDWQDVIPVTMVSNGSRDYLDAVLNPDKAKDILANPGAFENVIYRLRTAWDDRFFYVAAEVPDEVQASKKAFRDDPYAFPFQQDSVQLAFNVLEENPDDLLRGDRFYEKALAADVDYLFVATLLQGGAPELWRQCAPGTNYQTYYPTNAPLAPPLGAMEVTAAGGREGAMRIVRDDARKLTTYEIAIAWEALPALAQQVTGVKPNKPAEMRFAFAVTDAGSNGKGTSYWTREAGQVQSGSYGFAPFWNSGQRQTGGRVITRWGLGSAPASKSQDQQA
jgi:intracellular sulfur oxidation DsrE/DsrF family protein